MSNNSAASPRSGPRILEPARILYMDAQCIAVNKLCGEALEGAGAGMGDLPAMIERCLSENNVSLAEQFPATENFFADGRLSTPVAAHRLDVPVSGCSLFARTREALHFLNEAFAAALGGNETAAGAGADTAGASTAIEKRYWAIVEQPRAELPQSGNLLHWLEFDSKKNKSRAYDKRGPGRKKAALAYRTVGAGRNYLFLEIQLFTGRHHQIRCQFERMGLHIKGDLKYGARRSEVNGGIRLHARSLAFPRPAGGGRVSVQAEPPLMDNLWQAFTEQYDRFVSSVGGGVC